MSNVFDKFSKEINFDISPSFSNTEVVKAKLQESNVFKILFKNLESIPFSEMLFFLKKINDNFKYKADISFEIVSPTYNLKNVNEYAVWIIKSYLKKPYLSNIFMQYEKVITPDGKLEIKVLNNDIVGKISEIKNDFERIMQKFGFANLSLVTSLFE